MMDEEGINAIVKQQLVFALKKIISLYNDTPSAAFKCIQCLQSTVKRVHAVFAGEDSMKKFSIAEFLAKKVLYGLIKSILQDGHSASCLDGGGCTIEVPPSLGVLLITELRLTSPFITLLLNDRVEVVTAFLNHLTRTTGESEIRKSFEIVMEIWIQVLQADTFSGQVDDQTLFMYATGTTLKNMLEIMKEISVNALLPEGSLEHEDTCLDTLGNNKISATDKNNYLMTLNNKDSLCITQSFQKLKHVIKQSILDYKGIEKLIYASIGQSLKALKHDRKLMEEMASVLHEKRDVWYNISQEPSASLINKYKSTPKTDVLSLKQYNQRFVQNIKYYVNIFPDFFAILQDILNQLVAKGKDKDLTTEGREILDIMKGLDPTTASSTTFNMSLNLDELLSLMLSGDISAWNTLDHRELSKSDENKIVETLQKNTSLVGTPEIAMCCLGKLKHRKQTGNTSVYQLWNRISLCLLTSLPMKEANELLSKNIIPCAPGDSLFWINEGSERSAFLSDVRVQLNKTTKDDATNLSQLSHYALQAPYDVLDLIIKKGLSSVTEATLCIQILNFLWGLKGLKTEENRDTPVVIQILLKNCKQRTSSVIDAAVEIAFGLIKCPDSSPNSLDIARVIDLLIYPYLESDPSQVLFNMALGIWDKISRLDSMQLFTNCRDIEELVNCICKCVIQCIRVVLHGKGRNKFNVSQIKTCKYSSYRIQLTLGKTADKWKSFRDGVFSLLNEGIDLQDCWLTLYVADLLKGLGRDELILFPYELIPCISHEKMDLTRGKTDIHLVLKALFKVACIAPDCGMQLCTRVQSLDGIQWKDVILAVSEVWTSMHDNEGKVIIKVVQYLLSLASPEQLVTLLPRWIPANYKPPLLENVCLVSILAHACTFVFDKVKQEQHQLHDGLRKYSMGVKLGLLDSVSSADNLEGVCTSILAVLHQSTIVTSYLKDENPDSQVLCLGITNSYLDVVSRIGDKDKKMKLCETLHNLVKKISQTELRAILIQRISSFVASL